MDDPRMSEWNMIVLEIFHLLFAQYDPVLVVNGNLQDKVHTID
jgi:hypothetical protein